MYIVSSLVYRYMYIYMCVFLHQLPVYIHQCYIGSYTRMSLVLYIYLLHSYIPILMAQARIYWERNNYQQVEKIFRRSVEFCSENDTWKLNVAHVLFMQV